MNGGRPKGGLTIGISLKLRAKLSLVHALPPYAITGLISGGNFSLLVTNVYFPPGGLAADLTSRWESLEDFLLSCYLKYPNVPSITGGDFNARIASNREALIKSKWWVDPGAQTYDLVYIPTRISKDVKVNKAGVMLYQMALRLNLIILNGRCPPDIPGEFTHLGLKSNSVLDYVLVSRDLFLNVTSFKIDNAQFSDHLPLTTKLCVDWHLLERSHPIPVIVEPSTKIKGIRWSPALAHSYTDFIREKFPGEQPDVGIVPRDPITCMNFFSCLIEVLTRFFTSPSYGVKNDYFKFGAPWFNSACKLARLHLHTIYNDYKLSGALALPPSYSLAKKAYKQAQKSAKREWHLNRWQTIISTSKSHNSRKFWSLIKGRNTKYPLTVIPAPTWEQFLRKYFSVAEAPATHWRPSNPLPVWHNTDPAEILELIAELKTGKAPGPDLVPVEAIKLHSAWWAGILAKTFDAINATGLIPGTWKEAIIIPIYKKGPPGDPGNYRNISLLSSIGKIYARFLLARLMKWSAEADLIGHEQAGFRLNRSTTDQAIILYHLARKYSTPRRGQLCAAFIDLKAAFDSIPRQLLWDKLACWGIDRRLLWLISQLHAGSVARVRISPAGDLTNPVPVNKGVRQGCILAPLLFNLFISDMRNPLIDSQKFIHTPRIADYRCPLLLYADDAVLLSYSRVGLRRALKIFASYCHSNHLSINHTKSKVLIFSRSRKLYSWKLEGTKIEQVHKFKYLGIYFQYNLGWKEHVEYLQNKTKALSHSLLRFSTLRGLIHPCGLESV
ncbi:Hypothetical predicted protein [Podarcis lilfordi]|uniref:Reverse transcriptase domain-containing protein n=1 Tax=Podarcis lilfordi TaxID=74358 RepID=A0AA35L8X4_9SAUR|nr:Hypothetical predicted protein [Podarcis lilfordi]